MNIPILLQMQKSIDEHANAVDNKLAEMEAAQCQIGEEQVAEFEAASSVRFTNC